MDCFPVTKGKLRDEVYFVKFPYPVEGCPLGWGEDVDDVFHQDSVPFSNWQGRNVLWEYYGDFVVMD